MIFNTDGNLLVIIILIVIISILIYTEMKKEINLVGFYSYK